MLISRVFHISIQGKIALKSLIEGYKCLSIPLSNDPIRVFSIFFFFFQIYLNFSLKLLLSQQIADLEKLHSLQYSHYRIPPAILTSNLKRLTSFLINPINIGSKSLILDLHEIIEGNLDKSLILMNESGIEEKDLRKDWICLNNIPYL